MAGKDHDSDRDGARDGISRRSFIAGGAALGGAIVWSPNFAFARRGGDPLADLRALRNEIRDANLGAALERRLNVRIGRAQEAIRNENIPAACGHLERLKEFLDRKRGINGLKGSEATKWINDASAVQEEIGCNGGPTGPTGPTGRPARPVPRVRPARRARPGRPASRARPARPARRARPAQRALPSSSERRLTAPNL